MRVNIHSHMKILFKFSGIMTYNGLESCILNTQSYENESGTSRGDGCVTDFFDDESSCSSSKDAFGSFSSKWLNVKSDEHGSDEWGIPESPQHYYVKDKPPCALRLSDIETMKEKFAKLLLGEDVTGGSVGVSTALALSNAILNLAGRFLLCNLLRFKFRKFQVICFEVSTVICSFSFRRVMEIGTSI